MAGHEDTPAASGGVLDETTVQAGAGTQHDDVEVGRVETLKRGSTVDRYVTLELLGSGGMGVVYAAYDPNLDRRVALKLLIRSEAGSRASSGHARTLREAQAMAKLSHPNVVTVHDVGSTDGTVFIAMELVDGQTLSQWVNDRPRGWREVLDIFEAAGAGLVAAHAAGLVHRDFKLDNVMVGDDGRIRVMDFGLARSAGEDSTQTDRMEWSSELSDIDRITRTGALVGTPAYMAPELLQGGASDARADQFAFCVALFRCLYGTRPFGGTSLSELYESTTHGELVPTPRAKVPRWLGAAVRRGLAADPEDRYPSMRQLLAALEAGRRRRGRVLAGAGVGLVALAASGASLVASARECSGGHARFATVWGAESEDRLARSFAASEAGQAADAAERVTAALDAHGERWAETHRDACAANRRGEQSDVLLDRRMACLDRNLAELDALLGVFFEADRATVSRAVVAVTALADVGRCSDIEALVQTAKSPADAQTAAVVEELRNRMARSFGLAKAGRYAEAYDIQLALLPEAEATDFRPVIAEVEKGLATLHLDLGRPNEALTHVERACFEAEASQHDLVAARSWTMRVQLEGVTLGKPDAGEAAVQRAEAAVLRMGDRLDLRADVEIAKAALLLETGQYDEALAGYRTAVAFAERAEGPQSLLVARAVNSVGAAQYKLGRYRQAAETYERAHAIMAAVVGEHHPDCADTLGNIGAMEIMLGNHGAGRARLEEALAVLEQTLGPEHTKVGEVLFNLGWAAQKMGDPQAALSYFDRARLLELPRLAKGHPLAGQYEASIAVVLSDMERWEAAREHLQAAHAIFVEAYGPKHNHVARVLHDLGKAARKLGEFDAAIDQYTRALDIRREALPDDHPELADTIHGLTIALIDRERFSDALPLVNELVTAQTARGGDDPQDRFEALMLAGDVHRGLGEADSARERYEEAARLAEPHDAEAHQDALDRAAALPSP